MTCAHCGTELEGSATYCSRCGARVGAPSRKLGRAPRAGRIAGVGAGIAAYQDTDVVLVRLLWVVLSIVPGGFIGGIIAYLAAWIIMPAPAGPEPMVHAGLTRSVTDRKVAGVWGGIAGYLGVDPTLGPVAWAVPSVLPG